MQAHFVIHSYQILNILKVANLVLSLGQTYYVPVNMHSLRNLFVTATVFISSIGSVSNITIVIAVQSYDAPGGTVLLLECNNFIYPGQKCFNSLLNPIQEE